MQGKTNGQKKHFSTWLIVIIILLVGILFSTGIFICNDQKNRITVRFFTEEEELIQESRIRYGSDAIAPSNPHKPGKVFLGWNNPLIAVKRETNYRPFYRDIPQQENVFYIETGYVKHGKEYDVNIYLAGSDITVRTIQLGIAFDPGVLKFIFADSQSANLDEERISIEDNYIVLPLEIPDDFIAETVVASLHFQVLDQNHVATDFPIDVYAAYKGTEPGAQNADCITIKGTLYIY